jgi:parvulin-like peptidyl-prolyl isomerase
MHRRMASLASIALSAAMFSTGCRLANRLKTFFHGEEEKTTLVRIADRIYTKPDLDRFFESRLSEFRDPSNNDALKSNLLDSFVEEKLLLYQADLRKVRPDPATLKAMVERVLVAGPDRQGEKIDPARQAELELNLSNSLKTQQYLHDFLLNEVSVADSQCETYYQEHLSEYVRNDTIRVREILVDDLAQAQKIVASLKTSRNKNFADLARVYSKGASAPDGGDLGSFQKGELPEEFEKVVFALSPGNVSKVVPSRYGYHIFMVEERILAHQQKLIEVRDEIREKLQLEREREIINAELASLMGRIPVEVYGDRLDFKYVGTRLALRQGSNQ